VIRRWRDELDGTWHESGDLDQYDVEQDAARLRDEPDHDTRHREAEVAAPVLRARPRTMPKPRRNPRRV
jgi:hypothetical protein